MRQEKYLEKVLSRQVKEYYQIELVARHSRLLICSRLRISFLAVKGKDPPRKLG